MWIYIFSKLIAWLFLTIKFASAFKQLVYVWNEIWMIAGNSNFAWQVGEQHGESCELWASLTKCFSRQTVQIKGLSGWAGQEVLSLRLLTPASFVKGEEIAYHPPSALVQWWSRVRWLLWTLSYVLSGPELAFWQGFAKCTCHGSKLHRDGGNFSEVFRREASIRLCLVKNGPALFFGGMDLMMF